MSRTDVSIEEVLSTITNLFKDEEIADFTTALQTEEVSRWRDRTQKPMTFEDRHLRLVYEMIGAAKTRGISAKSFKRWFKHSRVVYDANHGYSISPSQALRERMYADIQTVFDRFLAR